MGAENVEIAQAAAIRELIRNADSIFWHRHVHEGGIVEYSMNLVSEDGKKHSVDGQASLLYTLLEACGVLVTKHCSRCREDRPIMDFSSDGQDRWCLLCRRERAREYRASKRGATRRCSRCNRDMRAKEFNKGNRWCKPCFREYHAQRYEWWRFMGGEYVI